MMMKYRLTITQTEEGKSWGEDVILYYGCREDAWKALCAIDMGEYTGHSTKFTLERIEVNEGENADS